MTSVASTEEQGLEVVQALAQFGVASSYGLHKDIPVVELGLDQAQLLVRVLAALSDAGQALGEYVAHLETEQCASPEPVHGV